MQRIVIGGGNKLYGEVDIQGSKNSTLPILAATVLVKGVSVIHNCPKLSDVNASINVVSFTFIRFFILVILFIYLLQIYK